ncbi:16S rRNA (uracil(1498)-N(3))-methyltransferase [Zavarzinia sp. CC-PAN008]|uniref:16S rRNA (uracil(1498)-N(3))-methyltransferase n=1 Tax=Zavarzinia sp. CC-PAN008 TaxID=3243332 RepID=UPI003F746C3F
MSGPRLCVPDDLAAGLVVAPTAPQAHYLTRVLRLEAGAPLRLFNGRDGEWRAAVSGSARHPVLEVQAQLRPQAPEPGPALWFAPLKGQRLELLAEKATELGASALVPVLTERTAIPKLNAERLRANAAEAAEQCERLTLPRIDPPRPLGEAVAARPPDTILLFCDESGGAPLAQVAGAHATADLAILIGPEGGFSARERALLAELPGVARVSLGPNILRAETAALAALAILHGLRVA